MKVKLGDLVTVKTRMYLYDGDPDITEKVVFIDKDDNSFKVDNFDHWVWEASQGDTWWFAEASNEINLAGVETIKSIDKHYDFCYNLTPEDIERGSIRLDPYFMGKVWKIGSRDDTGILFHSLKTIARFGDKNDKEREIKALYLQAKRLAEIHGVEV